MKRNRQRSCRAGIALMVLGLLLVGAALALLLYNQKEDTDAGNAAADILPRLRDEIERSGETGTKTLQVDGNGYIGYLTIPALELELPVMDEWSDANLKIAPCRYYGSPYTDDLVICGHNYTRHFWRLKELSRGDEVQFTAVDGTTITYEVEGIETLKPDEVEAMIDSGYELTLYTCTYGNQSRVTVRCRKTG